MPRGSILLIDDDALVLQSLSLSLEDEDYAVTTACGGKEAIALCKEQRFEVVVCDIRMPQMNGIDTLRAIKQIQPEVRTIVITGYADDPSVPVEALRLGVDDYLLKPFDDELLFHSVARNLEHFRLQQENVRLYAELQEANARLQLENIQLKREVVGRYHLENIVGTSPAMIEVYRLLEAVVDSDITVLLSGETGTGKEILARVIHYSGPRGEFSFVPVHCGAVQESLLESELFGVIPHYPGLHSPTGKKGLFEEADGGTLFLDEVSEMGPAMQVKLLRVLQDGEIQRVGDTLHGRVDVRLIAATNRSLEKEVEEGRFRQDLYYRLTGIEIRLPPLRERVEDIPLLARHFLEEFSKKTGKDSSRFTPEALDLLSGHDWPGNVRELEKEVERAMTLAGEGANIVAEHFSTRLTGRPSRLPERTGAEVTLDELERCHIQGVLAKTGWNIQGAAEILGIHRNTLTRKIVEHGLQNEERGEGKEA